MSTAYAGTLSLISVITDNSGHTQIFSSSVQDKAKSELNVVNPTSRYRRL
jgi:hypothetical protein